MCFIYKTICMYHNRSTSTNHHHPIYLHQLPPQYSTQIALTINKKYKIVIYRYTAVFLLSNSLHHTHSSMPRVITSDSLWVLYCSYKYNNCHNILAFQLDEFFFVSFYNYNGRMIDERIKINLCNRIW